MLAFACLRTFYSRRTSAAPRAAAPLKQERRRAQTPLPHYRAARHHWRLPRVNITPRLFFSASLIAVFFYTHCGCDAARMLRL